MSGLVLSGVVLSGVALSGVILSEVVSSEVVLSGVVLSGVVSSRVGLRGVDLSGGGIRERWYSRETPRSCEVWEFGWVRFGSLAQVDCTNPREEPEPTWSFRS